MAIASIATRKLFQLFEAQDDNNNDSTLYRLVDEYDTADDLANGILDYMKKTGSIISDARLVPCQKVDTSLNPSVTIAPPDGTGPITKP